MRLLRLLPRDKNRCLQVLPEVRGVAVQRARQGPPGAAGVHRTPPGRSAQRPAGEEVPGAPGPGAAVLLQLVQTLHL